MPHRNTQSDKKVIEQIAAGIPEPASGVDTSAEARMLSSAATSGRKKTVIRAEKGKPPPDPPHGGTWSRDPDTGDLTLVEAPTELAQPRASSEPPAADNEQPRKE